MTTDATLDQVTRVVLVHAHALVRQGIVRVLEGVESFRVVGDTDDTDEAVRLVASFRPTVAIVDAELPGVDGVGLAESLTESAPETRIMLIAERATQPLVERALAAGVSGFTLKDVSLDEFVADVQQIAAGETVLHPKAASVLASGIAAAARGDTRTQTLTPRQREILRLLAAGLENKQIARRLGIGVHTVKTHVSRVLEKLGAGSRTEAVVIAMREHIIG